MDRWNSDFAKHWLPDLDLQRAIVFHTSSMRQKTLNSGGLPGCFASSVRFNSINYGVTSSIHRQIDAYKYTEAWINPHCPNFLLCTLTFYRQLSACHTYMRALNCFGVLLWTEVFSITPLVWTGISWKICLWKMCFQRPRLATKYSQCCSGPFISGQKQSMFLTVL